jgi:hypothetical protein
MTDPLACSTCHDTHEKVHTVLRYLHHPASDSENLPTKDYVSALEDEPWMHWSELRCGHLSKWFWQELLDHMENMSLYPEKAALEVTARRWYELSREMRDTTPVAR